MTSEIIKEEFKSFTDKQIPDNILFLSCELAANYPGNYDIMKHEAYGFISGMIASEHLTKIETLKEIREIFLSNGSKVSVMVKLDQMLKELGSE